MILVIDTSLIGVAMALVRSQPDGSTERLWHGAHPEPAGSIQAISGLLEGGLAAAGCRIEDVAGIAVSKGPGSFTGIKIGLAFVYGLVRASARPVPTFGFAAVEVAAEALRANMRGVGGMGDTAPAYALLLPATRTHGFLAVTGRPPELFDATDEVVAAARLRALGDWTPLGVVGRWPAAQVAAAGLGRSVLEIAPSEVSRLAIYGMSERLGRLWPRAFSTDTLKPDYLRLSTAEERLKT